MKKHNLLFLFALTFLLVPTNTPVMAAKYSTSESKKVRTFQKSYHRLSQKNYDQTTLFTVQPNFGIPFSAGVLDPDYIKTSMAYVNYYRSLVGLPDDANYANDNVNAQLGAAALASVNAEQNLRAHGLQGYVKPGYISDTDWDTAENTTLGNINFSESTSGTTAGEIVTDLIREDNNIAGNGNIGHRGMILSTRATRMGIGAAYGTENNVLYSVEHGLFADDILRQPVKSRIVYPAAGVFPYELVGGKTPWSYSTTERISGQPKIYITDLTTKKKRQATQVRNFGTTFYGDGYTTTITYRPGKTKLINTHKYRVQIGKHYSYSFRFFRQNSTLKNKQIVKHRK